MALVTESSPNGRPGGDIATQLQVSIGCDGDHTACSVGTEAGRIQARPGQEHQISAIIIVGGDSGCDSDVASRLHGTTQQQLLSGDEFDCGAITGPGHAGFADRATGDQAQIDVHILGTTNNDFGTDLAG